MNKRHPPFRFRPLVFPLLLALGGVLYFIGPLQLARLLAHDLEALVINLAQDYGTIDERYWYADTDLLPWGKALLQWGSLPLFMLLVFGLGGRILAWQIEYPAPLKSLPARSRWAIALPVGLLFVAFCVPFSLSISVWFSVELFWWIQWPGNIDKVMEVSRVYGPMAAFFAALLTGAAILKMTLIKAAPVRVRSKSRRLGVGIIKCLLAAPILLLFLPTGGLTALHASRLAGTSGRELFETRCSGCHDRAMPLYYIKTPGEWRRTVRTQVVQEGVQLTPVEQEQVVGFLTGMRSFSDAWTFRSRCQRCHLSTWKWEDRQAREWEAIVDRISRWSPYYYRAEIKTQIARHLRQTHSGPDATLGLQPDSYSRYQLLYKRCASCHPISLEAQRFRGAGASSLLKLVKRMNRKWPTQWSDTEQAQLARTYGELLADPALLKRLFPHDTPEEGGLPW